MHFISEVFLSQLQCCIECIALPLSPHSHNSVSTIVVIDLFSYCKTWSNYMSVGFCDIGCALTLEMIEVIFSYFEEIL